MAVVPAPDDSFSTAGRAGSPMSSIDEKRVYGERSGATEAFVATGMGLARVSVSGSLVGEFGLADRRPARDVAAADGTLAVATDGDVLLGATLAGTGFGPASAVGFDRSGRLLAAGEGRVARFDPDDGEHERGDAPGEWTALGDRADVRAIDGDLVASVDGVSRVVDDGLVDAGLTDARDVAVRGIPRVATGEGLYVLGNGWMVDAEGAFDLVVAGADRAHAATAEALFELRHGDWEPVDLPVSGPVAGVAYAETTYAVTADGSFLVADGDDGAWNERALGLPDVRGVAVP